jgi:hypothetical protein
MAVQSTFALTSPHHPTASGQNHPLADLRLWRARNDVTSHPGCFFLWSFWNHMNPIEMFPLESLENFLWLSYRLGLCLSALITCWFLWLADGWNCAIIWLMLGVIFSSIWKQLSGNVVLLDIAKVLSELCCSFITRTKI